MLMKIGDEHLEENLEENPAHIVVVDRVQDFLLCQGCDPKIRVLIVVALG